MDKNEERLIQKAQRGNINAFESLVSMYDTRVMRLIYNMLNHTEDARDVYQDVFIKVYKSINKFRFQSEFYTWLYRIVVNTCINFRKKRTKRMNDPIDDYNENVANNWNTLTNGNTLNPEQNLLNKELDITIQNSVELLSKKQKTVFILRHYHGHKLSEIAKIMNCSEGTVKNYLFRAVQKMKNQLRDYYQN